MARTTRGQIRLRAGKTERPEIVCKQQVRPFDWTPYFALHDEATQGKQGRQTHYK